MPTFCLVPSPESLRFIGYLETQIRGSLGPLDPTNKLPSTQKRSMLSKLREHVSPPLVRKSRSSRD